MLNIVTGRIIFPSPPMSRNVVPKCMLTEVGKQVKAASKKEKEDLLSKLDVSLYIEICVFF